MEASTFNGIYITKTCPRDCGSDLRVKSNFCEQLSISNFPNTNYGLPCVEPLDSVLFGEWNERTHRSEVMCFHEKGQFCLQLDIRYSYNMRYVEYIYRYIEKRY